MEKKADFYELVYKTNKSYSIDYLLSSDLVLWKKAEKLLRKYHALLEIGCGTGQFGKFLFNFTLGNNILYYDYRGFDFCQYALEIAQKNNNIDFIFADAYNFDYDNCYDVIISLETFEHIRDKEVIAKFPKGQKVILSVPDFDSKAHLRYFPTSNDVLEYYKDIFEIVYYEKINKYHLIEGIKL